MSAGAWENFIASLDVEALQRERMTPPRPGERPWSLDDTLMRDEHERRAKRRRDRLAAERRDDETRRVEDARQRREASWLVDREVAAFKTRQNDRRKHPTEEHKAA